MDKIEIFKEFIEKTEVLIVDKNASSRNRLLKTIHDLGGKRHLIHTCGHITEAAQIMKIKKIGVVLSDYYIGGGSGFDLFKMLRDSSPNQKDMCFILVTANISQTAVAKAAEEDVDSFIIKPYTIQSIQENLVATIAAKIKPSDYILKIEEGKTHLNAGQYDEAIVALNEAVKLNPKPALALFYIGQAEYLKNHVSQAQGSYNDGLNFNSIHYKCLIGLYEIFMRENKFNEAYQIVKKIAKYFPANPDRLAQIVRLSIRTENYQDMLMYYEIYTSLEERAQVLTNYIGAGLYIAGKHYLINDDYKSALQYFDNIAVSCSEVTKFIRAIITVLVENDMGTDAEKYLSRFPSTAKEHPDYLVSAFLVDSKRTEDPAAVVKFALDVYNKNIRDFACMQAMIEAMRKCGYKAEKIAVYENEVHTLYPEKFSLSA